MAKLINEIYFQTPNRPGVLADVMKQLAKAKIKILNLHSCGQGRRGEVVLTTTNDMKAKSIIRHLGYKPKSSQFIDLTVPAKVGRLAPILNRLAKRNINVTECLFTNPGNKKVEVLLCTNRNKKAARIL